MYSKNDYIRRFPAEIQKGVRASVSRLLSENGGYVDYMGELVPYKRLSRDAKTEVIDEIMSDRLCNIEGLDHAYWVTKANSLASGKTRRR